MQYRIDVTKSAVVSNVTLDPQSDSLSNLFWDYSATTLYAAVSLNTSESIVTVNMTTGDFSAQIGSGPNFNSFGLVTIDAPNHFLYALAPSPVNGSVGVWGFDLVKSAPFSALP